ncbi:MAG: MoaD/ThiS family protein [Mariprofundaceae bacterium]
MSVKILFFGSIAERLKKRECLLPISGLKTIENVVSAVGCNGMKPLLIAVNQEQVNDMNKRINDGDEVALMPPFSGG